MSTRVKCSVCGKKTRHQDGICESCRTSPVLGRIGNPTPVETEDQEFLTPDKKIEGENVMKKFISITLMVLGVLALIGLIGLSGWLLRGCTATPTTIATETTTIVLPTPTPAPTAIPTPTPTPPGEYITVYRGDTDQETINFDNAWPGFYATDSNIKWDDTSFHMLGGKDNLNQLTCGNYTIEEDGIVSGDVWVNGVKICDDNENTFLVINVKKGDKVTVINDWKAWYTNHYDIDLVVAARQTAHPTWTRQESTLNQ